MSAAAPFVAVCGPGEASPAERAAAEEVGAGLARGGAVVVCGGLGGVMEAACRGARDAGGQTLGLLPGSSREAANAFVSMPVATGLGELRNGLIVRTSDAVVAVGGAFGTLSEIALALKAGKPVIALGSWELGVAEVTVAANAAEAVRLALAATMS